MAISVIASSFTPQHPVKSRLSKFTQFKARTVSPSTLTQWHSLRDRVFTFRQLTPNTCRDVFVTKVQLEISSRWRREFCLRTGISTASLSQSLELRNTRSWRLVLFLVIMSRAPAVILLAMRQVLTVWLMLKYKVTISRLCLDTRLSWNLVWRGRQGMMYLNTTSSHGISRKVHSFSASLSLVQN
jgi:hypothetical protein